jgi:hypothetical protein
MKNIDQRETGCIVLLPYSDSDTDSDFDTENAFVCDTQNVFVPFTTPSGESGWIYYHYSVQYSIGEYCNAFVLSDLGAKENLSDFLGHEVVNGQELLSSLGFAVSEDCRLVLKE